MNYCNCPNCCTDNCPNAESEPSAATVTSIENDDAGVWFQSAASGLWYQVRNAGGDISAVKIDGFIYQRPEK